MPSKQIKGSVALVTGGNRGIGRAIVDSLLDRGAAKVYVGARNTATVASLQADFPNRVVAIELDVTNRAQVARAAEQATDVDILVNNAGVASKGGQPISAADIDAYARKDFEVNVFGLVDVTQAFAPILEKNGGGVVVNIGSVASFVNFPLFQSYSASKAAVHSITQATRLTHPNTLVVGVYPGPVDTDMARDVPWDKISPATVAGEILDGIEAGREDIFPDPMSKEMGGLFLKDPKELERQVAAMAAA